ncbi:hypothetical protein VTO42DRAFT_3156 [Malbranchea cinnamomea]
MDLSSSPPVRARPATRKRASRACLTCRARKIRCDVTRVGMPCTNCRLDTSECVVQRRARRRQAGDAVNAQQRSANNNIQVACNVSELNRTEHGVDLDRFWSIPTRTPTSEKPAECQDEMQSDKAILPTPGERGCSDNEADAGTLAKKALRTVEFRDTFTALDVFSKYPFLDPDGIWSMSQQDIRSLEQRGCLYLPQKALLDAILEEYFLHVHPNLPVINEAHFWEAYTNPGLPGTRRISIFVLRAMLFAACGFLPLLKIHALGFGSFRTARAAFYSQAKILFDLDTKRNDLASAQGALLLTYYVAAKNATINSYWLGIAIHHARLVRADQYFAMSSVDPEHASSLKRLWWCCICRDRILSLGVRRPLQISRYDFDPSLPIPDESDFNDEMHNSRVYDPATKKLLVLSFNAQCELAAALTHCLTIMYPRSGSVATVQPPGALEEAAEKLDQWFHRTDERFSGVTKSSETHPSFILYINLAFIYYWCAYVVLPLVCYIINARVSAAGMGDEVAKDLALYTNTYRGLRIQYEGSEVVVEYIGKIFNFSNIFDVLKSPPGPFGTQVTTEPGWQISHRASPKVGQIRGRSPVIHLAEFLVREPRNYLRIVVTIDIFLATGKFPDDMDFPDVLRSSGSTLPTVRLSISPRVSSEPEHSPVVGEDESDNENDVTPGSCLALTDATSQSQGLGEDVVSDPLLSPDFQVPPEVPLDLAYLANCLISRGESSLGGYYGHGEGGRVHSGFNISAENLLAEIEEWGSPD